MSKIGWGLLGGLCWFSGALALGLPMYGLWGTIAWDRDPLIDMPTVALLPVLGLGSLGLLGCLGFIYLIIKG